MDPRTCPARPRPGQRAGSTDQRDRNLADRCGQAQRAPQPQLGHLFPESALLTGAGLADQAADAQLDHQPPPGHWEISELPHVPGMHPPRRASALRAYRLGSRRPDTHPQTDVASSTPSMTSDDNPGNSTAARSRVNRRDDHGPEVVTRSGHAEPTTSSEPEPRS